MGNVLESTGAALQIAIHLTLGPVLQRRRSRWGYQLRAPRSAVWPWLVQLGQGLGRSTVRDQTAPFYLEELAATRRRTIV